MTIKIQEGNLVFNFAFDAIKFDDSQYYREHFSRIKNGIAAVDILAVNNNIGYLIEVKDYRHPDTENLELHELIDSLINKIISTLAAILPMKNNANVATEKQIAILFSKTDELKVILHIELSPPNSKTKQSLWNFQHLQIELKKRLKPIDAHPKVVSKENLKSLPWTVN
jgi:hypothetical protein